jgi:hypothetical protein
MLAASLSLITEGMQYSNEEFGLLNMIHQLGRFSVLYINSFLDHHFFF